MFAFKELSLMCRLVLWLWIKHKWNGSFCPAIVWLFYVTEFVDIIYSIMGEQNCIFWKFWTLLINLFKVCLMLLDILLINLEMHLPGYLPLKTESPFSAFCMFLPLLICRWGKYPSHFFWLEESNSMVEIWAKNKLPPSEQK